MTFQRITDVTRDMGDFLDYLLSGYEAIDKEHNLVLETTNGRTRNARRWFVRRIDPVTHRRDFDSGRVCFRAWTLNEALERLSEPRIAKRIAKLAEDSSQS